MRAPREPVDEETLIIGNFTTGGAALPIRPRPMAPMPGAPASKAQTTRLMLGSGFFLTTFLFIFSLLESNAVRSTLFGVAAAVFLFLLSRPVASPRSDPGRLGPSRVPPMDLLPLRDQHPYRFIEPRLSRSWFHAARPYNARVLLRREQKVLAIDIRGLEHLRPLLERGDGVLITPNHPDNADPATIFEVSHRVGRPFHYLAAFQLFRGLARHVLPRIGAFPIDREGADLRAFKTGVEILAKGREPLVIFPEGEIYHVCDRLTPLREGAVAFATSAAKRLAESAGPSGSSPPP